MMTTVPLGTFILHDLFIISVMMVYFDSYVICCVHILLCVTLCYIMIGQTLICILPFVCLKICESCLNS